jgi:hypothetical protein
MGWPLAIAARAQKHHPFIQLIPETHCQGLHPLVVLGHLRRIFVLGGGDRAPRQQVVTRRHCFHDLRHTFISLLRSDGATKDILGRITHSPSREVLDGYTSYEWEVLCREVLKLSFQQTPTPRLATVFATPFATPAPAKNRTPGNLSASEGSFLRGVGDLNP